MCLGKRKGKRDPKRSVPLCRCYGFYPEDGCQGRKSRRSIYGSAPGREHAGIFAGSVRHEAGKDRIRVLQSGNPEKRSGIAHKRRVAGETDPGSGYVPSYGGDRDGGVSGAEIGGKKKTEYIKRCISLFLFYAVNISKFFACLRSLHFIVVIS